MAARFGNGGSRGRRVEEPTEISKAARYYDPEHRRQRRLGAAQAALAGGGAAALGFGVHGAAKTTRSLKAVQRMKGPGEKVKGAVAAGRKDLGLIAGGTAGLGGAGLVRQKAEGRKFGIWR